MRNKFVVLLPLIAILFISGCISGFDPEAIARSSPIINDFLDEHPNAELRITHFTAEQAANILDDIRADCDNEQIQAKEYYRVTINDPSSGLSAVAWIDAENQLVDCALRHGIEAECQAGEIQDCTTSGGSEGTQNCHNGEWGECIAKVPEIKCGDGICGTGETASNCPTDCRTGVNVEEFFNTLNEAAESVYLQGIGSSLVLHVSVPTGKQVCFEGDALTISNGATYRYRFEHAQFRGMTNPHPVTGMCYSGTYRLIVTFTHETGGVVFTVQAEEITPNSCEESDNHLDYHNYGVIEGIYNEEEFRYEDVCLDGIILRERKCAGDEPAYHDKDCSLLGNYICLDGACELDISGQSFCGTSTLGQCENDGDCVTDGCSGQICRSTAESPSGATTCEWLDCYNDEAFGVECLCVNNLCKWTTPEYVDTCEETDNYLDYYNYGVIEGSNDGIAFRYEDECLDAGTLRERKCITNEPAYNDKDCSLLGNYVCLEGACVIVGGEGGTSTCSDSDGGLSYKVYGGIHGVNNGEEYEYSDECLDAGTLRERKCLENAPSHYDKPCSDLGEYVCSEGVCIEECKYLIGGAVYSNMSNPLFTGIENVLITVEGVNGEFNTTSYSNQGLWRIEDVPCGNYLVNAYKEGWCFWYVEGNGTYTPPLDLTVDEEHEAAIQSIQFWGTQDC